MKKDRARGQKTPNRIKHLVNTSIKFLVRHYDLKDGELLLI